MKLVNKKNTLNKYIQQTMSRYKINNLEEYFKEYKNQFVSHESSGTKLLRKLHLVPRMGMVDFNGWKPI
jgi:uncharacterized membrane-anchored protein YhcB (DUF1043 family)